MLNNNSNIIINNNSNNNNNNENISDTNILIKAVIAYVGKMILIKIKWWTSGPGGQGLKNDKWSQETHKHFRTSPERRDKKGKKISGTWKEV